MTVTVHHGDSRDVLAELPDASVDAIVTDPPYELGFMGKAWDASGVAYDVELWRQAYRVLKPGGHLLAFGGTRTYHRLACAVEDAGFEIRDSLHWLYGSGFPKSLDVSKAIDKAAGAERPRAGAQRRAEPSAAIAATGFGADGWAPQVKEAVTEDAARWQGWGTALKPAHEPIVVARKPLTGTVAANVLEHGTGALNIDGCRVAAADGPLFIEFTRTEAGRNAIYPDTLSQPGPVTYHRPEGGRWPANVLLTHAAECQPDAAGACAPGCPVALLDTDSGTSDTGGASRYYTNTTWDPLADAPPFRYVAKPSKRERNAGLDGLPEVHVRRHSGGEYAHNSGSTDSSKNGAHLKNHHPTVKPLAIMRWLTRLVTPPRGTVLDPFAGSGTTLAAAVLEGFDAIGIELTADYLPIIAGRVAWAEEHARKLAATPTLFDPHN